MDEAFTSIGHLQYSPKNVSHPYDLVKLLIQQSFVFPKLRACPDYCPLLQFQL